MGDWDDSIKLFIRENAQDLVTWLWQGAQVKRQLQTEFKVRTIEADSVLEIELENNEERMLFHIEIQSTRDMPGRLLQYSVEANHQHQLAVYSCVIYLRDVGEVPKPPLEWKRLDGKEILWFDYMSVELAKLSVEELKHTGLNGLKPLWVLAKNGARQTVVEEVVHEPGSSQQFELLSLSRLFVDLVFTGQDQDWVERIFNMYSDPLSQTPTYQKLVRQGREEGLQQGLQQGREEGLQEGLQKALLRVVEVRFPALVALAQKTVPQVEKPETLDMLLRGVVAAPDEHVAGFLLETLAA